MELNNIYASILEALHVRPTPEGLLSYESFSGPVPLTVRDMSNGVEQQKRLALPTDAVLQAADWDAIVPFHPLSEHLNRGVSPVMNALVKVATLRLTEVISSLLHQLIEIAATPTRHAKISPQAQKFLTPLQNADKKTLTGLVEILKRVDMTPDRKLVSIYLKRKGVYRGATSRVCVIGFPIMEQLQSPDRKVWGVKLSQKELNTIEAAMQYILPDCDQLDTYSAPSESKVAPYFESFLDAYEKVAIQLNKVIQINREELDLVELLRSKMDWGNLSEDLYKLRSTIPPLDGNKGTVLDDGAQESVPVAAAPAGVIAAPAMIAPPPVPMIPAHHLPPSHQSVTRIADTEESLSDRINRQRAKAGAGAPPPGYPPHGVPPGYAPQPGYGYPPPGYAPPGYPMMANPGYPPPGYPAPYPQAMYPAPGGYPPPGYPQAGAPPGYPQPGQPIWMGNANGQAVAGSTALPMAPQTDMYGRPLATSSSGMLF